MPLFQTPPQSGLWATLQRGGSFAALSAFVLCLLATPALAQPTFTGLQPADGTVLASGQGTLTGTATGAATLSINGTSVSLDAGGAFSWAFDLPEGPQVIQLYAEDAGGLSTSRVHQLVVDTRDPQVSVTQPSSSVVGSQPVAMAGTYFEPHLASLTVAGVAATASGGTWSVSVPLVEGAQALTVAAADSLGHSSSFPITLTLDTIAPTLSVTESGTPFSGGIFSRPVTPVVSASDATDVSLELVLDGAPFVSGTTIADEGGHTLDAIATDAAGHVTSAQIDFVVDTTSPTIGTIQPASGTVLAAASATLQVETGSGAQSADLVRVTGPGGSVESSGSGLFTVGPVALAEGTVDLLVEAFDDAGNRTTRTHRLVVDTTPPVLTVTAPQDGDVVSSATVPAQGIAQDARLQSVTVNGALANLVGEGWSVSDVPLVAGANVVTVIATDSVGNQTTQTVTVQRDTAAPVFQVLVGGVELVSGATFSGPVSPVIQVDEVQFPGATVAATLDGATFASGTEVSSDGSHELSVTVTSAGGVSSSRLLVFVIDQQAPTVSNIQPADGHLQSEASVSLSGSVSGAQVMTVNGQPANLFQSSFSAGPFPLSEGVNTLTLVATGANGLDTTASHTIERDSTPPQVAFSSPADGALLGEVAISVSGTAIDPNLDSVTVNETPAVISASTWNAQGVPLREGSTTLTVRAEDAAGNVTETSRTVILDTEAPTIEITDPAPGTLVPDATYEVRGTVTEEHLDRVDVAVTSVETGDTSSVRATVEGSSFFVSVPLASGTNQITATARDRLGATTSDTASIERDADAPQVRIVVPGDGAHVNDPSLEVRGTVNDEEGITVRVNGLVAVNDRGSWVVQVDLSQGENQLLARATDAQGNEGVHTRVVHLDQQAPTFESADPASGALALPVDTVFRLEFSEPLADPEEGSWALTTSGSPLAATAVVDGNDLRITPDAPLPSEAQVELTLSAALTDRAGNALANPPAPLTYTVVDVGAPDAAVLDFEPSRFLCSPEVVLSGTAEASARVDVEGGASSTWVRAEEDGTFLLTVELLRESLNRLELTVTDSEGNVSPATVVEVVHDCTGPEVTSSELVGQILTIGFSEAIEESTVTASPGSVSVSDAAGALAFTVSATGDEATLTLASAPAGSVLLDVGTGVLDLAANPLAYPYRRVFGDASGAESFVSGTVIDDSTGRPLAGATVQITATDGVALGDPLPQQTTGADGRFLIPVSAGTHDLTAARPGYAPVFRIATSVAGEGTDVFDPRLTPMSPVASVGTSGGTVSADVAPESLEPAAQLTLPSGALAQSADLSLTQLGEQALPALLPYGWSPRGAVWLESEDVSTFQSSGTLSLPVRSTLGTTPAGTTLELITLDLATLQWQSLGPATVANGQVQISVASIGAYAAVEADTGTNAPPAAVAGQVLGSSPSPLGGEVASATLVFDPEIVLPTQRSRATATYTLTAGAEEAPSGLPLTLVIEEELELLDGSIRREAPYRTDLIVYRDDLGGPSSEFWLRPSDTARSEPIYLGGEDVTILPYGDETVRGNVLGPDGGSVLSDEGDRLDVPVGALTGPAAIVLERQAAADLPLATPRGAVVDAVLDLDLGGARLESPADLTIAMTTPPTAGTKGLLLHVVEIETDQGPQTTFRVVAELAPAAGGWETMSIDPLDLAWPGVLVGGQLAAVRLTEAHGFVRGEVIGSGGQPVEGAVVSSDAVDWVQITDLEGRYVLPLPVGDHVVTSRSPQTGNAVQVSVTVSAGDERVDLDPTLQIVAPWIAEVTPADGAAGIPVGVEPTVRFSEPVDRTTLAEGLELLQGGEPIQVEFDHQGDFVRILPQATLVPDQTYELRIGGEIRDLDGYGLNGLLTTSFRTEVDPSTTGRLDRSKVTTLAPDSQGLATVTGVAGAVPGDSLVYVENLTSYSTTESVTADQAGAFQLTIGASLDDRLLLHVLIDGSSEDLMTLGPFLSADLKSAYVPEDGADWTTAEGLDLEVQPGTFGRATWVRAETRASGPIETPEGFDRLFDFDITFGGVLPSKKVFVSVPTAMSVDSTRDILLNRFVEALGVRGWMFMDFLRLEGGLLTNARLEEKSARSDKVRSLGDVSIYPAPQRQGVWSLSDAQRERSRPGSAQFGAPLRVSLASQTAAQERRSLYFTSSPPSAAAKTSQITDPRDSALGVVEPGTYQGAQLQTQQPIAWAAIPVDRPDLMVSSDSFGGAPYVSMVTTRILTLMTGPWVLIPTRWNEEFTLEVRDLTTGYVLGRTVQDASTEELTLYPDDVYADSSPPLPVGGHPIRFFLLSPAQPVTDEEVAEGITYDYSASEELVILGGPGSVAVDVEITAFSVRTGDQDSTHSAATGGFSLRLTGVQPQDTVILAISSKIGPGDTLEIRFSEALAEGAPGLELYAETDGSMSPNPVGSSKSLAQDGTLVRMRPETGWKKGRYELRLSEELLGETVDGEPRKMEIGMTVEGSSYLDTLELDQVGDMAQLGSLLYMAALDEGLMVWDVTHPKAPRPMLKDENGDATGFPFPNGGNVRGVDIDSHGRAVVVGGGESNFGQLKVVDLLAVDWQAAATAGDPSVAIGEAFRGSTLISDPLTGTAQTVLRNGTPRRVAVASNDSVNRWRLWKDAPPTGVTVLPATKPNGPPNQEVAVQITGGGVEPKRAVSVHNATRGRWDRAEADESGDWSVTADLAAGDEIELRRNSDVWAYATIDGAGIAVVDVASILDEDLSDPNIAASIVAVADGLPVGEINAGVAAPGMESQEVCDPSRVDISTQPVDIEVLYDAEKNPQLTVLTLYTGYGLGIQAAAPSEPGILGNVAAVCGAVEERAILSALDVVQDYPMDFDGDGQFGPEERGDYAVLAHAAGHILIFDVTERHAPIKVAQIPVGKEDEVVRLASLSVDRRHRRILAAAFGEGLYVVDFSHFGTGSLGRIDRDDNGLDDRVLETIEVTSEEVTDLLLMPDFGIAFAAGRQRGLTSLLVGPPRVETVSADQSPLRYVSRAAPYGVSTAPESDDDGAPDYPGMVRFQVQMPGLSSDSSVAVAPRSEIYLDVAGVGPEDETFDGAGDGPDMPPASYLGLDALRLKRQADDPWEEGYRLYLSDPVLLLSDLRASAAYEEHEDELDVCTRCDLVEQKVYAERPLTESERYDEMLSGHKIRAAFTDFGMETEIEQFYDDSPFQHSVSRVNSVPWDLGPSVDQEPRHHASTGQGDVAPGTLLHSGEMTLDSTDVAIAGRGLDFAFRRTYRNQTVGRGPLGPGWDHTYRIRLRELPDGNAEIFDGQGRRDLFEVQENGDFKAPKGWFVELKRTSSGWTLTDPKRNILRFDRWGRLVSISDALKTDEDKGNQLTFHYDAHSRLQRVDDSLDRAIQFEYDDRGLLMALRDFTDREFAYKYDAEGRLETFEAPPVETLSSEGGALTKSQGPLTTTYAYDTGGGDLRSRLRQGDNVTSVTDPKQQEWLRLTWTDVDGDGVDDEIQTQTWGEHTLTLSLDPDANTASVTDRRGNVNQYQLNSTGQTTRVTDPEQAAWTFEYDDEGLIKKRVEPDGKTTETVYESGTDRRARGNAKTITVKPGAGGENGSGQSLVTTVEYDSKTNQPIKVVSPKGTVTEIERDDNGLAKSVTRAKGTAEASTETYDYNVYGQVRQVTDALGKVMEIEYFDAEAGDPEDYEGYAKTLVNDVGNLELQTTFEVDELGRQMAVIDPRGVRTEHDYNDLGWRTATRTAVTGSNDGAPPLSYVTTVEYDANGNVAKTLMPVGQGGETSKTEFTYGVLDEVSEVKQEVAEGQEIVETWDYDENYNPIRHTDGEGQIQETDYDLRNLPETIRRGLGANALPQPITESLTYDANRRLKVFTDGRSHAWTREYDGYGRVRESLDPLGNKVRTEYDDHHQPLKVQALEGQNVLSEVLYSYDGRSRMQSVTQKMLQPQGLPVGKTSLADQVTSFDYDALGNVTKVTDPKGRDRILTYDSLHRMKTILDPMGNQQVLTYDAGSNVIVSEQLEMDGDGAQHSVPTTLKRDALGRLVERKNALGHSWTYSLGADGLARQMTDPEGFSTAYSYDLLSRMTKLTRPEGISETYVYDKAHRVKNYIDALGQTSTYAYDAAHRQTSTTYADGGSVQMEYTETGELKKRTDQLGTEVTMAWDPAGRRTSSTAVPGTGVTLAGPLSESFTYDGLGRLESAISGSVSTQLSWDSASRLLSESTNGRTVEYERDATGMPTSVTDSSGHVVTRTYDALDRLATVAPIGGGVLGDYDYRGFGPTVHRKSLWNGLDSETIFDPIRRPTSEKVTSGTSPQEQANPVYHEESTWTPRNLKSGSLRHDVAQGRTFTYDGGGRLKTQALLPALDATLGQATKTSIAKSEETFTYNAAQALTSRSQWIDGIEQPIPTPPDGSGRNRPGSVGDIPLNWNLNGNLVERGTQQFVHDWRNRLRKVIDTETGETVAEYDYDAFNRRVAKTVAGDVIETVFQGWQEVEQYKNGQLAERRTFGQSLEEMVKVEKDLDGDGSLDQEQVPVYDGRGNLALIADSAGRPLERYEYTSFGGRTILGSHVSPEVEQIRLEGDEIWIETSLGISENLAQQAMAADRIYLEDTSDQSLFEITAHQPVKTGANARRRLIITTTGPPAAGTEVRLVIPKEDFQDEFQNTTAADVDLTFLWQPQIIQDTAPPRVALAVVRDGHLELTWSETPDLTTAPQQITLDGQPLTWTLDETSYTLISDADIGQGEMTLAIGTGPSDLSGQGLAEAFTETFTVLSGQDQVVYLGRNPRELDNSAVANQYGFQGRPVDEETGLMYFRNRYYDPAAGVFVTADPLGYVDGPSMYAFAGFDPVNMRDPLGLCFGPWSDWECGEKVKGAVDAVVDYVDERIETVQDKWKDTEEAVSIASETFDERAGNRNEMYDADLTDDDYVLPARPWAADAREVAEVAQAGGNAAITAIDATVETGMAVEDASLAGAVVVGIAVKILKRRGATELAERAARNGGQVPVTRPSKSSWPSLSATAPDWGQKGAHLNFPGRIEVAIRPTGTGGVKVVSHFSTKKQGFSSGDRAALQRAKKETYAALQDLGFRQRLFNASSRAAQLLEHNNDKMSRDKVLELHRLMADLASMGLE